MGLLGKIKNIFYDEEIIEEPEEKKEDRPRIEEVKLPNSISKIEYYALYSSNTTENRTITLPDGTKKIITYYLNCDIETYINYYYI